ncbi:MAG TPA: hypothetical protein DG753_06040 [Clostridium sp.]|nr:hypothetical protein [Clostridium sp.]
MNEKYINLTSSFLYYIICPSLLGYFSLIDLGVLTCSLGILCIFTLVIAAGVGIICWYKKKDSNYNFNVNKMYEKVMCILVLLELAYSFSK